MSIIKNLSQLFLSIPDSKEKWQKIADDFNTKWNYPNALGAIDGKHIMIEKPSGGGSIYYNYKHHHSIVLMAIVGPNYECLYADVGATGRCSDGVFGINLIYQNYEFSSKLYIFSK